MQENDTINGMPATLAEKVYKHEQQTKRTAVTICRNAGLPAEDADTLAADAADMLHARYEGLRATSEQMRRIADAVPAKRWDRTQNAALCLITNYYRQIADILNGETPLLQNFITSVVVYEVAQRDTSDNPLLFCDEDTMRKDIALLYYTYAVLIIGERCDATEAELRSITPPAEAKEAATERTIQLALDAQAKRLAQQGQKPVRKRGRPRKTDTAATKNAPDLPALFGDNERTIYQYQNIAYMIGSGVQTADTGENGQALQMRPLWRGVEEQRRRAAALVTDVRASDEDRKNAAAFLATTYAVGQVIDGLQILPQMLKPVSGDTQYSSYEMTPHEYTRLLTGQEKPNSEQTLSVLKATAWLATQRMQVAEVSERIKTLYDSSGVMIRDENGNPKRKKEQITIYTNFQPVVVTFSSEYKNGVPVEEASRVRLSVHKIIKDGRSATFVKDGKKRLYISKPRQQYLEAAQYYQFTTEEERIFRNLILSRGNMAEDALLRAVFNYDRRQAVANQRAIDAQTAADEMQRNPTATDAQKTWAQEAADNAKKQAKSYLTDNMGRDYEKLAGMFEKAQDCGLLKWYYRDDSIARGRKKKYGSGYVWCWGRTEDEDGTNKAPKKRGRPRKDPA